jgi:hypothetical protein
MMASLAVMAAPQPVSYPLLPTPPQSSAAIESHTDPPGEPEHFPRRQLHRIFAKLRASNEARWTQYGRLIERNQQGLSNLME